MDDKLKTVECLLESATIKSTAISSQIKYLKGFNKRLELLLSCFKAYSFSEAENTPGTKDTSAASTEEDVKRIKPSHTDTSNKGDEARLHQRDFECEISRIFEDNKANRNLAMGIYALVGQKEPITLDDLVRGIKQSKYKVIDIINMLIKERIIIKSFDRGFVYKLNK